MIDAEKDYGRFIQIIADSADLYDADRLKVLKYAADTCMLNNWNLLYLECRDIIEEIERGNHRSIRW